MKRLILVSGLLGGLSAFADVPQARVEFASAYKGYATIGGTLESAPAKSVGVSILNGGLKYSTITDSEGKWSIVIKHRGVDYSVETFALMNTRERSLRGSGRLAK